MWEAMDRLIKWAATRGNKETCSGYTCGQCHQPMRLNVPRLGPQGGFVHAKTGKLDCQTYPYRSIDPTKSSE